MTGAPGHSAHAADVRRPNPFAEDEIARRDGRLVLIETSSQASYESTTRFYERCGYGLIGFIVTIMLDKTSPRRRP
jgi:hypothetical protein